MECNKEEAIRAKGIAEKKMKDNDFVGSRRIAIKAQRLYPDLVNISQMICVCDVHCSSENQNLGKEKNWYEILKVEHSADDVSIKKQYRKLALLLHPDKNKFAGAESAFILIGEAQKVLLDKEKRSSFDARYMRFCHNTAPNPPPQEKKSPNEASDQKNTTKNASCHVKKPQRKQARSGIYSGKETFCTVCPFCGDKCRHFKYALNANLLCQSCKMNFIAYDMCSESTTPKSNANKAATSQGNTGQKPSGSNAKQTAGAPNQQKPGVDSVAKSRQSESEQVSRSKKTNELDMRANGTTVGKQGDSSSRRLSSQLKRHVSCNENGSSKRFKVGSTDCRKPPGFAVGIDKSANRHQSFKGQ